jgi:hypothetical protein
MPTYCDNALNEAGVKPGDPAEPKKGDGKDKSKAPSQAELLIELASGAELFHTPDDKAFADVRNNGHRETRLIRSKAFRRWLANRFYQAKGGAPHSEAMQSALNVIEGRAHFEGSEQEVFVRIGGLGHRIYIDIGDETWRAIEIDVTGWKVVSDPPVRFRRAAGMRPLPLPVKGGSVTDLKSFLNIPSGAGFELVVFWLLAALRNCGPYPILVVSGEQGSAKSTFAKVLRALVDPNAAPLRALPREDRDLFIAATNGHVLVFDNVSGLPHWISDTLCRLATGGGFAVRQLYSDDDEVLFDACRPIILNGIEDIVTRPDLADRAIFLTLAPIEEEQRKPEADLWADFEAGKPKIFGALLDAMVVGLRRLAEIRLPKLPRMADFALWASACETAIWESGTFWNAYCGNQADAVEGVLEADPVAEALLKLVANLPGWLGTSSSLLDVLREVTGEQAAKEKSWPKNGRALSERLRRSATFLRKVGIEIAYTRADTADRTRLITISKGEQKKGGKFASGPSNRPKPINFNGCSRDANLDAKSPAGERVQTYVHTKSLKPNDLDDADAMDARIPPYSVGGDDLSIPTFLDRRGELNRTSPCAQCNADDDQQIQFGEVWLHKECKPFYFGER